MTVLDGRGGSSKTPSRLFILLHAALCTFVLYRVLVYHTSRPAADLPDIDGNGPIEDYLNLDPHLPETAADTLRLHRVRQFDRVIPSSLAAQHTSPASPPTNASAAPARPRHHARCAVFSCASPGYWLTDASLSANAVRDCDRLHFSAYTYNAAGERVASTWCRVPLLQHLRHYFGRYERVLYVDPDIRYRDPWVMKTECDGGAAVVIATKPNDKKAQHAEMQMNWLLICDPHDARLPTIFAKWDKAWRDVHMQDQTVFNEVWRCGDADGGIKCVQNGFDNAIVVFHCGGYLPKFLRSKCMHKHF